VSASAFEVAETTAREAAAWAALAQVLDPEVPVLSVCDLGLVRGVHALAQGVEVVLTPTYSGCPATEVIALAVEQALLAAGLGPVTVIQRREPAWTSDWISEQGRSRLREYGIAPPSGAAAMDTAQRIGIRARNVVCPRCNSSHTERLSAFGSTACKALHRCLACREPFEHFKPI